MTYIPQVPFRLPSRLTLIGSENNAGSATRVADGTYALQTNPSVLSPALGGAFNQWYSYSFNAGIQRGLVKTGDFWTLYLFVDTLDGSNANVAGNAAQYWVNSSPDPSVGPYLPKGTNPDNGFIRVRSQFIALDGCGDPTYNGIYSYVDDHTYTKGGVLAGHVPYIETNAYNDYDSFLLLGDIIVNSGQYNQDNSANNYHFGDSDPASYAYVAPGGSVNAQGPTPSNYVSPIVLKGGPAAGCRFYISTPLPGIPAPAGGHFSVWQGTNQTLADTPLPASGVPVTLNGVTYVFTVVGGVVTGATVQAELNASVLNFVGTQIFCSGTIFTWSQYDIVRDPATRTNLMGKGPLVMAHWVFNRDYGGGSTDWEREITEAMAIGISGFALNAGDYEPGYYEDDSAGMFAAAEKLSPDGAFKVFWSFDGMPAPGIPTPTFVEMMQLYWQHPNYWRVQRPGDSIARPVISTYAGNSNTPGAVNAIWQPLLGALDTAGIPHLFMPNFSVTDTGANTSIPPGLQDNFLKEWGIVDGLFNFAVGDGPLGLNEDYSEGLDGSGRLFIASLSPHYWAETGHIYVETHGYESLHEQVISLVSTVKPDFVELVTYNDIHENTHFTPEQDPTVYWPYVEESYNNYPGYICCHKGYSRFMQYAIPWISTGIQPTPTQNTLLWAYRKHSITAHASAADPNGPPNYFENNLVPVDEVHITAILADPTTITVTSPNNGVSFTVDAPAGITHYRTPFAAGMDITPTFGLSRNGTVLGTQQGTTIVNVPQTYNLGYDTGFLDSTVESHTVASTTLSCGTTIQGTMNTVSPETGKPCDILAVDLLAMESMVFTATGSGFVPFLTLKDSAGTVLATGSGLLTYESLTAGTGTLEVSQP